MITSRKNSLLKTIRQIRRRQGELALLEGPNLVSEAVAAKLDLRAVVATSSFLESSSWRRLQSSMPRPPLEIDSRLLASITDSDSPRGILAVVRLPRGKAADLPLLPEGTYVYAEGLQDPGNLGALARVIEASGATALCLSAGSVHPNHPRALRASAGSLLRLPVAISSDAEALDEYLSPHAPRWTALSTRKGQNLFETAFGGCIVLALGSEGRGLSAEVSNRSELELTIPMTAPVESLNVTVAAALTLFEIRRQRAGSS